MSVVFYKDNLTYFLQIIHTKSRPSFTTGGKYCRRRGRGLTLRRNLRMRRERWTKGRIFGRKCRCKHALSLNFEMEFFNVIYLKDNVVTQVTLLNWLFSFRFFHVCLKVKKRSESPGKIYMYKEKYFIRALIYPNACLHCKINKSMFPFTYIKAAKTCICLCNSHQNPFWIELWCTDSSFYSFRSIPCLNKFFFLFRYKMDWGKTYLH